MTRTQNIKKNLLFNIIKFVTQLVLQFILRTFLIYYMGKEYLGLNGLFSNIFNVLNLAELGIGSAIVCHMYKPIAENDIEKIKSLHSLYKRFYMIISVIVGVVGLAITPFIKYLMNGGVTVDINIYVLYLMYLAYTLVGYWSAHKRSLLFAYQRNDVENKIRTIITIGMTISQIIVLVITKNYYIHFSLSILFTLLDSMLIQVIANKLYPEINGKSQPLDNSMKKEITQNVIALSMHKVANVVVFSTDQILISAFLGIAILGVYSNYYLITSSITLIFMMMFNSFSASVGDLMARKSREYNFEKFKDINFIFAYLSSFCTICCIILFQSFMLVWTNNPEYLLDFSTVILVCLSMYFSRMRQSVLLFKEAGGYYRQDMWRPIAEAIVNLVVSIVLVKLIGINGIFIGTIVSTLVAPFWVEPYVLYKHYFKRSVKGYFARYALDFVIMCVCCVITYFVCSLIPDGGIWWLILKFVVCILLSNILLILAYLPTKEFKELFSMAKGMLKNIFKKKPKKEKV